jgi:hypothetical protein
VSWGNTPTKNRLGADAPSDRSRRNLQCLIGIASKPLQIDCPLRSHFSSEFRCPSIHNFAHQTSFRWYIVEHSHLKAQACFH